ncbi:hypothetical protein [Azospirillum sp. sgz302134]
MSGLAEPSMRGRLACWIKTASSSVAAGSAAPEEVLDALLDVMLSAPVDSLIVEAGRGELPSRSGEEAKAVFTAMIEAIKAGA